MASDYDYWCPVKFEVILTVGYILDNVFDKRKPRTSKKSDRVIYLRLDRARFKLAYYSKYSKEILTPFLSNNPVSERFPYSLLRYW